MICRTPIRFNQLNKKTYETRLLSHLDEAPVSGRGVYRLSENSCKGVGYLSTLQLIIIVFRLCPSLHFENSVLRCKSTLQKANWIADKMLCVILKRLSDK